MKAIARPRPLPRLAILCVAILLASCSAPRIVPEPKPTPTLAPPPPLAPVAPPQDWQDAPITPGDWKWGMTDGQSVASFANGVFTMRCDPTARTVELSRTGNVSGSVPMTVVTEARTRQMTARPVAGRLAATLAANDPLLDAMAFSRGRFAIEATGLGTLYVPSWPEVSRVIEDCR